MAVKNRRELLKAIPFLAAIPFVRTPNSVSDLFKNWKSYPNHVTVDLPAKTVNIHPFDLASLLNTQSHNKTVDVYTRSNGVEITGVLFKVDVNAKIATDGGKNLAETLGKNGGIVFDAKDGKVERGWVFGGSGKHATFRT